MAAWTWVGEEDWQVDYDWGAPPPGIVFLPYYANGDFSLGGARWQSSVYLVPSYPLTYPQWSFANKYALVDYDWQNGRAVSFTAELRQSFRYDETKHYITLSAKAMVDMTSKLPSGAIVTSTPQVKIIVKLLTANGQEYVLGEFPFDSNTNGWAELFCIRVNSYFNQSGNYTLVFQVKVRAGQCNYHGQHTYYGVEVGLDDIIFNETEGVATTDTLEIRESVTHRRKMIMSDSLDIGDNIPANTKILKDDATLDDKRKMFISMSKLDFTHSKNPDTIEIGDIGKFRVNSYDRGEVVPDESLEINRVKLVGDVAKLAGFLILKWTTGNKVNILAVPEDFPVIWRQIPSTDTNWKDLILGYHE